MKRIEIGMFLQPKNEDNRDGTLSKIDNIVCKDNVLDRVYCSDICAGFVIGQRKIMAKDLDNDWVVVNMISQSTL